MTESIGGYFVHPVASKFPLLSEQEATELRESIKQNGQREPIKVTKDKVLVDGRNRLLACVALGIDPAVEIVSGNEDAILKMVVDANIHRRHLTTSQRAALAAEIWQATGTTADKAAKALNVSRSSVTSAEKVNKKGTEELKSAVREGRVDVGTAARVVDEAPEKQNELAASETRTEARTRGKKSDADFSKKKWRDSAERKISTILSQAPVDLRDWASREVRDIVGAPAKREAAPSDPSSQIVDSSEDMTLIGAEEFVERIDRGLKDVPSGERKRLRNEIGQALIGRRPQDYLPDGAACGTHTEFVQTLIGEAKVRLNEAKAWLDDSQLKPFKAFLKALKAMIPDDAEAEEAAEAPEF